MFASLEHWSRDVRCQRAALLSMALVFGIVCILPNIWQRMDPLYTFQGIEALGADQEHFYAARIREVMDGHWLLGDPYHATKDLPYLQPFLPEWVMGGMATALGLTIGSTILLMKTLFGATLFGSMALFWRKASGKPWLSLLATSGVVFSWFLFSAPRLFLALINGGSLGEDFARFSRLTNPQFSGTLFFLVLYCTAVWYLDGKRKGMIFAAVITGLSLYAYPYTWSYLLVVFGLLLAWSATRKEWRRVRDIGLGAIITCVIGIPFLVHTLSIAQHPSFSELSQRFGVVASRQPVGGVWMFVLLGIALLIGRRVMRSPRVLVVLAMGAVIVMNQQIITGTVLVPHHYHWYFIHPLAVAAVILAAGNFCKRLPRRTAIPLFGVLLLGAVLAGVRYQNGAYRAQRRLWGEMQAAAGVFAFLNTQQQPIAYADDLVGSVIPVFTDADVSFAGAANVGCLCPFEYIRDSYFLEMWLKGVTAKDATATFPTTRRTDVSAKLYGLHYRETLGAYDRIPDDKITEAIEGYRAFAAAPLTEKLQRAPTEIFVRKTDEPMNPHIQELLALATRVYEDGAYEAWDITAAMR